MRVIRSHPNRTTFKSTTCIVSTKKSCLLCNHASGIVGSLGFCSAVSPDRQTHDGYTTFRYARHEVLYYIVQYCNFFSQTKKEKKRYYRARQDSTPDLGLPDLNLDMNLFWHMLVEWRRFYLCVGLISYSGTGINATSLHVLRPAICKVDPSVDSHVYLIDKHMQK